LEETWKAEAVAERERLVGILVFVNCFRFRTNEHLYYGVAELSPPPEPYDPKVDPSLKGALEVI
jgi:hypothetical protein